MKKIILGVLAATAVAAPLALVAAPAEATTGTPGCVTRAEYAQVHKGLTRTQVARITGTWGTTSVHHRYTSGGSYTITDYRRCNVWSGPRPVISYSTLHKNNWGGFFQTSQERIELMTRW